MILYKYRSLRSERERTYAKRMIVDGECYLASPTSLNDPFDFAADCFVDLTPAELDKIVNDRLNKEGILDPGARALRAPELREQWNPTRNFQALLDEVTVDQGVFCLSRRRDSVAMWSHYADGHRGICVGFDEKDMRTEIGPNAREHWLKPVMYSGDMPRVNLGKFVETCAPMLLTKSTEWEYEQETRLLSQPGTSRIFRTNSIKHVILGCAISTDDERRVVEWCESRTPSVRVLRASKVRGKYALRVGRA